MKDKILPIYHVNALMFSLRLRLYSHADLLTQFSLRPVWGLDLTIQQQVLLGGHMIKEDVILHADSELFADFVDVCMHVFAIHLYGAH